MRVEQGKGRDPHTGPCDDKEPREDDERRFHGDPFTGAVAYDGENARDLSTAFKANAGAS
jgi:hypothetical protein